LTTKVLKTTDFAADLTRLPASDVKKRGWKGVMRALTSLGSLVITNHSEPEAVIVTAADYERLLTIAATAEAKGALALATLRLRFDERLGSLQRAEAADQLRAIVKAPAKLRGKVKAGTGH